MNYEPSKCIRLNCNCCRLSSYDSYSRDESPPDSPSYSRNESPRKEELLERSTDNLVESRSNFNNQNLGKQFNFPPRKVIKPPDDTPVGMTSTSYKQNMLNLHNDLRIKRGLPPVTWSDKMAEYAQEWANYLAMTGNLEHRKCSKYGENLYFSIGKSDSLEAFENWAYGDRKGNFTSETKGGLYDNISQMVWDKTRKIGCAKARYGDNEYHVCNYYPPLNNK